MKAAAVVGLSVLFIALTAGGVYGVVRLAAKEHELPSRCGASLVPSSSRCCAPGQTVAKGHCSGEPTLCGAGFHMATARSGCVVDAKRIAFPGGRLALGAEDWQTETPPDDRHRAIPPFALDAAEVTVERWAHCVQAGACRTVDESEPGLPVTSVDVKHAERFCRFEGGRLPASDEWLVAASGLEGRHFPWGQTGLVCRRAVFAVEDGPCAAGGGPDIAGSRPSGTSPEGVLDLAGNVAEWTLEPDGSGVARGGSYRSRTVGDVSSFAVETPPAQAPYVGFRCAYGGESASPSP